jgi:hypothetical protein
VVRGEAIVSAVTGVRFDVPSWTAPICAAISRKEFSAFSLTARLKFLLRRGLDTSAPGKARQALLRVA